MNITQVPIITGLTLDIEEIQTACRQLKIDPELTFIETTPEAIYLHWSESLNRAISRQMSTLPSDCIDFHSPVDGWVDLSLKMIPAESGSLVSLRYILTTK